MAAAMTMKNVNGTGGAAHAETAGQRRLRETRAAIHSFLHTQLTRGCVERFELLQESASRAPTFVDDWEARGKADELTDWIYAAAVADSEDGPEPSASPSYVIVAHRSAGDERASRHRFRVPAVVRSDLRPIEAADARGQAAQGMRHLNDRHESEGLFLMELSEQLLSARLADQESMRAQRETFEALLKSSRESYEPLLRSQAHIIEKLGDHVGVTLERAVDLFAVLEELTSQKHERDLAAHKAERKLARGDRLFDNFFPIIAKAVSKKLTSGGDGAGAGASSNKSAAASSEAKVDAGAAAREPSPAPDFTESQLKTIALFLQGMTQDEAHAIFAALGPASQERFLAIMMAFQPAAPPASPKPEEPTS